MSAGAPAYRLRGIELGVGASAEELRARVLAVLGLRADDLASMRIARRSLDARRRGGLPRPRFVHEVELVVRGERASTRLARLVRSGKLALAPPRPTLAPARVHASLAARPAPRALVVGAGPAGLLCALVLARGGLAVELIERGAALPKRGKDLVRFHRTRVPDPESNLLYGEGGAGTYSDGKLYTRVDDPLEAAVLELLVACGAQEEIRYDSRAHVGTDRLHRVLPRLREELVAAGVRYSFETRLEDLLLEECAGGRRVRALRTSRGELGCEALFLATGHGARDVHELLLRREVPLEAKPFQLGLRIEHPQELVDRALHGLGAEARLLGPAYYALVSKAAGAVCGAHSFCMCPGGRIVAAVAEPGLLCTNGMSDSRHSSRWANAALVVTVDPRTDGADPLVGVRRQVELERRFFEAGGADYGAPAQRAHDFLAGRESAGSLACSYRFGARPGRLDLLLPPEITAGLRLALGRFERVLPGFAGPEGLFVGLESKSSGPVRIPRARDTRRAQGFANLYPMGEGAGWAGGIMSAALDGARCALAFLEQGAG